MDWSSTCSSRMIATDRAAHPSAPPLNLCQGRVHVVSLYQVLPNNRELALPAWLIGYQTDLAGHLTVLNFQ
eukprot:1139891-Pelagomonas_calceolata.AAC.4